MFYLKLDVIDRSPNLKFHKIINNLRYKALSLDDEFIAQISQNFKQSKIRDSFI